MDLGCGRGDLLPYVAPYVGRYIGVDVVRYDGFPDHLEFHQANLDAPDGLSLLDGAADVVTAVETIEHLENPRALVRLMARIVRAGGVIVITTPNQLSLLSLLTLVTKGQFSQFQDVHYPAHLTALLPTDLRRIAAEGSLIDVQVEYSLSGRMPLTSLHYPRQLSRLLPERCSDNVLLSGRRAT